MKNITVDGVEYAPVKKSDRGEVLVILDRGWVFKGVPSSTNEITTLTNTANIRNWKNGFGAITKGAKSSEATIDPCFEEENDMSETNYIKGPEIPAWEAVKGIGEGVPVYECGCLRWPDQPIHTMRVDHEYHSAIDPENVTKSSDIIWLLGEGNELISHDGKVTQEPRYVESDVAFTKTYRVHRTPDQIAAEAKPEPETMSAREAMIWMIDHEGMELERAVTGDRVWYEPMWYEPTGFRYKDVPRCFPLCIGADSDITFIRPEDESCSE